MQTETHSEAPAQGSPPARDLEPPTREASRVARESDRRRFAEQGYLVLRHVTDAADIAQIRALVEPLFTGRVGFREGRQFDMAGAEQDGAAPRLPQILGPRSYAPELGRTRLFARAHRLATELLGPEARFRFDHVINKPAHDGAVTPWHQDEAFHDPSFHYAEISIWVPLQPVDDENGCMQFIPGTGGGEVLPHRSPDNDARVHAVECFAGFDPAAAVACPLDVGDCTVHTGRVVHGAGANHSAAPRYAYVMVFERPPQRRNAPRSFPWQADKLTTRMLRERAWRRRGGYLVLAWRRLRALAAGVQAGVTRAVSGQPQP